MTSCTFRDCTVNHATGAGGSLAIFDTSATITDCAFEGSVGTALLFESSSASGEHKISVSNVSELVASMKLFSTEPSACRDHAVEFLHLLSKLLGEKLHERLTHPLLPYYTPEGSSV